MGMNDRFLGRRQRGRDAAARRRIERLTSALVDQWPDHPEAQEYMRFQWGERVLIAHVVSRRAQKALYFARWLIVVGATIVPTLVTAGARTHGTVATVTQVAAVVLSLLVAVAASALQAQMGQRWHLFNQLEAELEHAGWQLFARRGEYVEGDLNQRFASFADRVEGIVLAYQTGYSSQMARLERDGRSSDGPALPGGTPNPLTPNWNWP
jgi:acid phosphatase family membrane protein YuiD